MMYSYQKDYRGGESFQPVASESSSSAAAAANSDQSSILSHPTWRIGMGVAAAALGITACLWTAGAVVPSSMMGMSFYSSNEDHRHDHDHYHDHDHDHPAHPVLGLQLPGYPPASVQLEYDKLVREIDWNQVEKDIEDLLTDSQDWWPADYGHYGGLFIRLSWHSCGSYRTSDGRGGCDGGAQRFDPERSWPDNTNLDKARRLLAPIKAKYGNGLSWGDLFAASGTVAIKSMGGPVLGFCAGRVDVQDNSQTLPLGPTPEQDKFAHCEVNGACPYPLGQNTLGLIYVNPEGPMGEPDPQGAADTIRDVFGRMDWKGRELVALIGGGHTFGKAHGASTASNGEIPEKCPFAPWNGPKGVNAITSGFEGPWTSKPTEFGNQYFRNLVDFDWEVHHGPGGHSQWRVVGGKGPQAPVADLNPKFTQDVMMLTTDIALKVDSEYQQYVQEFAANETAFAEEFAKAWFKLVTRDMGPIDRCLGPHVPPAQDFQEPLPNPPKKLADMNAVTRDLNKLMNKSGDDADEFVRLAFQCASTFRATDYKGGCNGARIRFHLDWPINAGLGDTLIQLEPIKEKYGTPLTWADLIVLAGNVAAERAGSPKLPFCPGRSDASAGWKDLEYKIDRPPESVDDMIEIYQRRGQTAQEFVALTYPHFRSSKEVRRILSAPPDAVAAEGNDDDVLMEGLLYHPELRQWADYYAAAGDSVYGNDFRTAWTRLMNADRFDGPVRSACAASSAY